MVDIINRMVGYSKRATTILKAGFDAGIILIVSDGAWRSLASALAWGARGREFKSPRSDQIGQSGRAVLFLFPKIHGSPPN